MRFRWKLAFLLLIIALLPIVTMRLTGVKFMRHMADELIGQVRENRIEDVQKRLRLLVDSYAQVLNRGKLQIETALLLQAEGVERALADPSIAPRRVYLNEQFNAGVDLPPDTVPSPVHFYTGPDQQLHALKVSFGTQVFKLSPGHNADQTAEDMARLATLTPLYQIISKHIGGMAFWHYTTLSNGLHAGFPAHSGFPEDMVPARQPWYTMAFKNPVPWTDPYVDPATRQVVLASTRAVRRPDGEVAGVTAIVIPVSLLLEQRLLFSGMTPATASFMVYKIFDPESQRVLPRIFARDEYTDVKFRNWGAQVDQEWLLSSDETAYGEFLGDLEGGASGIRRMAYKGVDSLWVYGPTDQASYLVLITPYATIIKPAQEAKVWVQSLIDRILSYTGYGIVVIILVVLVLALAFSQSVTRPLGQLMDGVVRLASGDLSARVRIRSRDEFGDLGQLFNSVGPRLEEHGKMRHTLVLARQVQQSLLPDADPQVPGLDIAGRCVFCDETGGDYYDYLHPVGDPAAPLAIVVGDVSGHGLPSALLMATARALLRQRACQNGQPFEIMADVNRQLNVDVEPSGQFMTMLYASLDTGRRKVVWVRAGHEPGVIYDPSDDVFQELEGKGIPLGVFGDTCYEQYENAIAPGQILVLMTDGIRESIDERGRMFGNGAFYAVIREHANLPAAEMVDAVMNALARYRHPVEQKDDCTLVIVKVVS